MTFKSGPYRDREVKMPRPQPFHRYSDLRRVEVFHPTLQAWVPMYLKKSEIHDWK